jgi:three-Cys-motif partner protein
MRSIEIFLNFPIMDINRNVLRRDPAKRDAAQTERLTRYWGDDSWRNAAFSTSGNLFGFEEKTANDDIAEAFRTRLKERGGFSFVPKPMPMRNTNGATIYYLYFASHRPVASKIVSEIFRKYANRKG